jgi:large-conductance mechanosensitive channel
MKNIANLGHQVGDTEELQIQKSFLVYLALFMSVGGIVWGSICLYYGLTFQSLFPYSYVLISALNLVYFSFSKHIRPVRFIQVFISLALPFLFQWSLGGFNASGTIMLWAILALIASLTFQSTQTATGWLAVYLFLTLLSALIDDTLKQYKPEVLPDDSIVFVVINLTLISTIVFGLVVYFIRRYKDAEENLEKQRDNLKRSNLFLKKSHDVLRKSYEGLRQSQVELMKSEDAKIEDSTVSKQLLEYEKILSAQKRLLSKKR